MLPLFADNLSRLGATLAGAVVLLVLLQLQERVTSRFVAHHLGWRAVLLTGWLGVSLHELSHLGAALFFGHRIVAWKLFDPDPVSGTLGYVRHAYRTRSLWQLLGGFFIAIAPVVLGGLSLAALFCWMVPPTLLVRLGSELVDSASSLGLLHALGTAAWSLALAIWEHRTPWLPLQIYFGLCVACHMAPSRADLVGGLPGGLLALLTLVAAAALAAARGHALAGSEALLMPLLILLLAAGLFQSIFAGVVALVAHRRRCSTT